MRLNTGLKLIIVKLVHTIIWAVFACLVFYVLWSGFQAKPAIYAWWAVAAVFVEGLVLALFGWKCPLTLVARKYSDAELDNFDIFLPNWLARNNKLIFTTLFLIGVALMCYKQFLS